MGIVMSNSQLVAFAYATATVVTKIKTDKATRPAQHSAHKPV